MLRASSMKEVGVLTTWRTKRFTSVRMTCLVDRFLILCSDTYNRTGLGWFSWQKTRGLVIPVVLKWGTSRSWFWWEACEMHTFSILCVVRLFWEKYCCHIEILVSLGSVFLVFMCKVEICSYIKIHIVKIKILWNLLQKVSIFCKFVETSSKRIFSVISQTGLTRSHWGPKQTNPGPWVQVSVPPTDHWPLVHQPTEDRGGGIQPERACAVPQSDPVRQPGHH